jgi:ABC-2 type transport system permease protein
MPSKAIKEHTAGTEPAPRPPQGWETAPSLMREDSAGVARYVGLAGAFLVILGGIFLVANLWFKKSTVIGPGWATFFLFLGLIALLFHAAFDTDLQFRRLYMAFSYAALAVGVALCFLKYPNNVGDQFQAGFLCMSLALVFLLAFLRNETDPFVRLIAQRVLGGGGAVMVAVGLVGGNVKTEFLLPIGLQLSVLGFVYLAAFVGSRGTSDDQGYYAGLGIGAAGALAFVVAFARSFFFKQPGTNYLLPNGLLLMGVGLGAVLLSLLLVSEGRLVVLTRRELGAFFYSPVAYFVLFAFTAVEMFVYITRVDALLDSPEPVPEPVAGLFLLQWQSVVLMIAVVPALTMRLFSEERRTGTLEVMLTTPVNETTVVLSKFFAAFFLYVLVWAPFGLFLVALRVLGGQPFDYYPALSFGIAVAVTGTGFIAMGLFFSSLTRNQLIGGVLTLAGMIILTFIWMLKGILLPRGEQVATKGWPLVLQHMGYIDLWIGSIMGTLELKYMIFHLSLAVFFLFLTVKVLEARKWL